MADKGWEADARHWAGRVSREYRLLLLEEGTERTSETVDAQGRRVTQVVKRGMDKDEAAAEMARLEAGRNVALGRMLRWKVRYFTDGAAVGSRGFVDGLFAQCRERFGPKRTSGARKMRGAGSGAAGLLWSVRDLRQGCG
jgi:hypothetical protein